MAYIFGLLLVAIFFLALHYFTELTKSQKAMITSIVLLIVLGAVAFNAYGSAQRNTFRLESKINNMVASFEKYSFPDVISSINFCFRSINIRMPPVMIIIRDDKKSRG